jgi:hypothetical protein
MSGRPGQTYLRRERFEPNVAPAQSARVEPIEPIIQPKLEISRTDDPLERDAERMAAQADEQQALDEAEAQRLRDEEGKASGAPSVGLQRASEGGDTKVNLNGGNAVGRHSYSALQVHPGAYPAQRSRVPHPVMPASYGARPRTHLTAFFQPEARNEPVTAPDADAQRAESHDAGPTEEQATSLESYALAGAGSGTHAVGTHVQRRQSDPGAASTDVTSIVSQGTSSGGRPLDSGTQDRMERGFGHSFADVRVHVDAAADASAAAVRARAYTVGHDIVFRAGQYAPETTAGRGLLAHELAHTIQQGSAPTLQRAPDGGPPSAAPAAQPTPATGPQPPPSPASPKTKAPDPTGTPDDKAQVAKAIASKDPGDVKDIKNVNAATEDEKLELIRILTKQTWVGPFDEYKLEEIWRSFGERLPEVAGANLLLWQDSINGGAEVMKLPAVQKILIDYMNDVKQLAMSYLDKNRAYIIAEKERLGIGVAQPTAEQDRQLKLVQDATVNVKKAMQQQAQLKKIHVGYSLLGTEKGSTTGSPAIPTWTQKRFDPTEPPQANLDKDEKDKLRDYNKVKTFWDPEQNYIDTVAKQNPAIYSALQNQEDPDIWESTDPLTNTAGPIYGIAASDDPAKARAIIGQSLSQTQTLIDGAKVKIMSDKPSYRAMTPLNAQLMGGSAPSLFSNRVWREPFNKWIVEQDLKEQAEAEFYKELGVQTLTAAAFVVLELATAGTATFFVVAAAGSALTGANALESVEKFQQLADASRTNVSDSTRIVDKTAVHEAGLKAMQDVAKFLEFVGKAGIKAVDAALPNPSNTPGPARPGVDARTGKKPDDALWTWSELEAQLTQTEDGRRALAAAMLYRVKVEYGNSGESKTYYDPPPGGSKHGGTVVISRRQGTQSATLSFIHEMNHAEWENKGASIDKQIHSVGRDTYVGTMVMEESMGLAREIRAKNEMNRSGGFNQPVTRDPKVEQAYNKAVGARMTQLRAENNNYSEDYLRKHAHVAGEQALFDEFMKGNVRSSVPAKVTENGKLVTKENPTYVEYYGSAWDAANSPPPSSEPKTGR